MNRFRYYNIHYTYNINVNVAILDKCRDVELFNLEIFFGYFSFLMIIIMPFNVCK